MSEQEPSYYEIALTNRQVLVAFVILLCCVLAAFFAGVWVGRGSPAAAADAPQQAAAPTPTLSEEQPQELAFFSDAEARDGNDRPDLPELADEPRTDTTLAQDLGVKGAPAPGETAAPPVGQNGQPTASPAGQAPAPAGTTAAAGPRGAPGGAGPGGPLFIQVFSSRDELQAKRLETRLRAAGFKAFLSPAGAMYRVRIGPFAARPEAETAAARARRDFRVDTWITTAP